MRRALWIVEALLAVSGFLTIMLAPPFTATWIMTIATLTTVCSGTAWFVQTRLFERWCARYDDHAD